MKKKIFSQIIASASIVLFTVFLAGWSVSAAAPRWSSTTDCQQWASDNGWGDIPAIMGFVCDSQIITDRNNGSNICTAWIGPEGDSQTSTIEVPEESVTMGEDGYPSGTMNAKLYGMCTDGGSSADNVFIANMDGYGRYGHNRGDDPPKLNDSGINVPSSFTRGDWGNPNTNATVTIDIGQFVKTYESGKTENADGSTEYKAEVWLNRCYAGSNAALACDVREATITLKIPKLAPTYAAQSQIWATGNKTGDTGAKLKDDPESERIIEVTGDDVAVGEETEVRFSHNALASAEGDYSGSGFNVELTIQDKDGADASADVEKDEKNEFVLGSLDKFSNDKYDATYHYAEGAGNYDTSESIKFVSTKLYGLKFKKGGVYKVCEKITFEEITTGACITYDVEGGEYYASSAVVVENCETDCFSDGHADTTIKSEDDTVEVDSTSEPLEFDESADDEEYTYDLTFVHNVYANKELDSGNENKYSLEKSGDFDDRFVTADFKASESTAETVTDKEISDYKKLYEASYYIPSDPAKDYSFSGSNKPYTVVHVYKMTIKGKNGSDFILGTTEDSKELEFCEEITHAIKDGEDITTKACHKIKVTKGEAKENEAIIEDSIKLSGDGLDGGGEEFTQLVWSKKKSVKKTVEGTIEIGASSTSAKATLNFKFGVYAGSNVTDWEGDIAYKIDNEGDGWSESGATATGDIDQIDSSVSLSSSNYNGVVKGNSTTLLAYKKGSSDCEGSSYTTCLYLYTTEALSGDGLAENVAMGIQQDVEVEFTEEGEYEFCKVLTTTLESGDELKATVCAKITVEKESTTGDPDCPEYYETGKTHVFSGIQGGKYVNNPSPTENKGWYGYKDNGGDNVFKAQENLRSIIYVKPGDEVKWIGCYYPGAQENYAKEIHLINGDATNYDSDGHALTDADGNTSKRTIDDIGNDSNCEDGDECSVETEKFGVLYNNKYDPDWKNFFQAETNTGKGWEKPDDSNDTICYSSDDDDGCDYTLTVGKYDPKAESVKNSYKTVKSNGGAEGDVGKVFYDQIWTNTNPLDAELEGKTYDCHVYACTETNDCACGTTPETSSCCCNTDCCGCEEDDDSMTKKSYNNGKTKEGTRYSTTEVRIPYNYKNSSTVGIEGVSPDTIDVRSGVTEVVYAGDTVTVTEATLTVGKKNNAAVQDEYATQIPGGEARLVFYVTATEDTAGARISGENTGRGIGTTIGVSDICSKLGIAYKTIGSNGLCAVANSKSYTMLNAQGNLGGEEKDISEFKGQYNAFDAEAGDWLCAVTAIYPYIVKSDKDLKTDANLGYSEQDGAQYIGWEGTKQWYVSPPKCIQIAKKPSFEVWGGSIFTNGAIESNFARKSNLLGVTGKVYVPYPHNSDSGTFFGSWGEEGVTANGPIAWFASGAATGWRSDGSNATELFRGADNKNYCEEWVPLTIANSNCSGSTAGNADINSEGISNIKNRKALVDFWANSNSLGGRTITKRGSFSSPPSPNKGETIIYDIGHGVNIDNNIEVSAVAGTGLQAAASIPKVVIYANGDINIRCDVTRIDAILIATGNVDTCYNHTNNDEIDHPDRSKKLVINGMVIADSINLRRTYGAAIGNWSGEPAEVINYDSSALIWGNYMASAAESSDLVTTFQQERAPRY